MELQWLVWGLLEVLKLEYLDEQLENLRNVKQAEWRHFSIGIEASKKLNESKTASIYLLSLTEIVFRGIYLYHGTITPSRSSGSAFHRNSSWLCIQTFGPSFFVLLIK